MTLLVAVAAVEVEVVDAVDALHIHREPLEPVGQFARDRRAFEAGDLLEVGELRHFHAVAPAFPAEPPGAERRAFPVVLDEADVVQLRIDADRGERLQIEVLQVRRRRLQDHLELVVVLQPVGVLAVAAVLGPARRLHIGRVPRLRPERAQRRRRVKGAGAHLHVVGLQDHAALLGPEALQREDQALERAFRAHVGGQGVHRQISLARGFEARGTVSAGSGESRRSGAQFLMAGALGARIRSIEPGIDRVRACRNPSAGLDPGRFCRPVSLRSGSRRRVGISAGTGGFGDARHAAPPPAPG